MGQRVRVRYTHSMTARARKRRGLLRFIIALGAVLGASYAGGCNTASFSERSPCRGAGCTCEEDPEQPLCKGFNEREDASLTEPFDANPANEAGDEAGEAGEAGDAEADAPEAGDDPDAG